MKRLVALSSVSIVAALALAAPSVWAQQGSQATPRGGESPRGATASPRGGGEGARGGGGSTGGGGSSMGSGSFGGSSSGSSGGGFSGGSSGGYASSPRYRSNDGGSRRMSGDSAGQAVPRESRPRGDRPSTGAAVSRGSAPPNRGGSDHGGYGGYYGNYGGYYGNYGYGSYYGYDPFFYGFGSSLRYGLPYYWGFGASYYYDPFYWGSSYYDPSYGGGQGMYGPRGYYGAGNYRLVGDLKLKVQPKEAEVYVDGYFAGSVDDFDGVFQSLRLEAELGPGMAHRVEIRCQGYEPVSFEVRITPGHSITYRGELQKLPGAVR